MNSSMRPLQPGAFVSNPSTNLVILVGLLGCAVTWRARRPRAGVVALAWTLVPVAALTFGVVPAAWIRAVPLLGGVSHWDNCGSLALIVLTGPLAACGWAALAAPLRNPHRRRTFPGASRRNWSSSCSSGSAPRGRTQRSSGVEGASAPAACRSRGGHADLRVGERRAAAAGGAQGGLALLRGRWPWDA
jgi:hypothetical protein